MRDEDKGAGDERRDDKEEMWSDDRYSYDKHSLQLLNGAVSAPLHLLHHGSRLHHIL